MSVAGSWRRSLHQRKDSDEIDVFEAARYFSDYNDTVYSQSDCDRHSKNTNYVAQKSNGLEKHHKMKEILKKSRSHPSSPGSRIASFLNSLFSQSASKKKKKSTSSSAAKSMKDDYDGETWKRRRRSSISHFQSSSTRTTTTSTTATNSAKSLHSPSSSGLRTPPPYVTTPASKSLKYSKTTYLDQNQVKSVLQQNDARNRICMDKKFRGFQNGVTEFRKFEEDDGAESDSSSDLFELQNYDLGFISSELPVYETTHIDSIKRGTTVSNVA